METWDQMTARHRKERREAVKRLAEDGLTQKEAARVLNTTPRNLNNYVQRYNLTWPNKRQWSNQ